MAMTNPEDDLNPDVKEAAEAMALALPGYKKAEYYYNGGAMEWTTSNSSAMVGRVQQADEFTGTLNYAKIPVDTVADRMQLLTLTGPDESVTEKIKALWTENKMDLRFGQYLLDVLKMGDGYMSVWPDGDDDMEEEEDLPEDADKEIKTRLVFADPETTRAFYGDDGHLKYVARMWQEKDADGNELDRISLFYKDAVQKYFRTSAKASSTGATIRGAGKWVPYEEEGVAWPMPNPWGVIPYFHASNEFPYGTPEHASIYGVQDAINKIFRTHIAAIEFLGFPLIYALIDDTKSGGTSDFEFPEIDGVQEEQTGDIGLEAKPGGILALRAQQLKQLEPAGSSNFIESLKQYKEIASELTGLPSRLFSSTDGQHPSADAVNAAAAVLNHRVADRENMIEHFLREMLSFALKVEFGIDVPSDQIKVAWQPHKIEIDEAVIKQMEFKLSLGIPTSQILAELGYDATQIAAFEANIAKKEQEKQQLQNQLTQNSQEPKALPAKADESTPQGDEDK